MKPLIAMLAPIDDDKQLNLLYTYISAIEDAGGAPLIIPYTENKEILNQYADMFDGICFTGGVDIEPRRFGEETKEACGKIQLFRDKLELDFFDIAFEKKKPIIGICRGAQVINVALGGTLYQDIPTEIETNIAHRQSEPKTEHSHEINVMENTPYYNLVKKTRVRANSFHHQSAKDLGRGLKVMATADDGVIEALYYDGDQYVMAYQWHPERLYTIDDDHRCIFDDFISAVKGCNKVRYKIDHDYHIHSQLSSCSRDPEQTKENILLYAKKNGLKKICITDHYWDSAVEGASNWYSPQNFEHISKSRPLPKDDEVTFLFGCEADMKRDMTIGVPQSRFDDFDFIIIPTTHLHMNTFTVSDDGSETVEERAVLWVKRLEALLNAPLPFHKVGIAHLACSLIAPKSRADYLKTLSLIPSEEMERLFTKAAALGVGIELNKSDMSFKDEEADTVLRMFRIAKKCGCKFYLGSDSHLPREFVNAVSTFERAIDLLDLTEDDKFHIK